jgi:hypothetical protein
MRGRCLLSDQWPRRRLVRSAFDRPVRHDSDVTISASILFDSSGDLCPPPRATGTTGRPMNITPQSAGGRTISVVLDLVLPGRLPGRVDPDPAPTPDPAPILEPLPSQSPPRD